MSFPTVNTSRLLLKWWNLDPENEISIAEALTAYGNWLEASESYMSRKQTADVHSRLYMGASIANFTAWKSFYANSLSTKLKRNIIASCVDTAMNRIAGTRPAPKFLTNGADFNMRRKAPKLDKFGKGMLIQSRSYELGPIIFRDACIFGTGISKICGDKKTKIISNERVFPWNIFIEESDAFFGNGKPRTMTEKRYVDRQVLCQYYPKFISEIMAERGQEVKTDITEPSDRVAVWESWHLPSTPDSKDGRHAIAINNALLFQEEWTRPHFPFAIIKWQEPVIGFWGGGIAGALTTLQYEINYLLSKIQFSMDALGVTKILMNSAGNTPRTHINNEIGTIITYAGNVPPVVVPQQSVHPELFQQVDRLVQQAYAEIGLSELSAESRKPAGLDSGKALREYNDIESERFIIIQKAYEQYFMDIVACALDEAREIPGFSVDVPDKKEQVKIDWKDVDLQRDAYRIQCFPMSMLPQTPAGRTQQIDEWQRSGTITQEQGMELMDIPDLEEATSLATAAIRATRKRVESMLDTDDTYQSPEPYDDLRGALRYVNSVYLDEREKGCPEDKLDLLRRYMNELTALMNPPPAQPPVEQPGQAQSPQVGSPAVPQTPVQPLEAPGQSGKPAITDPGQMVS